MVSLQTRQLKLNDIVYPIVDFAVYFSTPRGIASDLDVAIGVCVDANLDPELHVRPVAVALTDKEGVYEIV